MAGKKEVQKTVAFRLNIAKEEERELYHAIMKHGRGRENDIYGSSGAYVKAALRHYHRQESELELQEQNRQEMQSYLKELAEKQSEVFLDKLVEHDKRLAVMVAEAVMRVVDGGKVTAGRSEEYGKSVDNNFTSIFKESIGEQDGKTEQGTSLENTEEDVLPEEALAYLSGL
ncbi:MAG: hypothetical protein K2M46_09405 [Lachnospiraceae bacterium]|nr:hypothetical protein [Lachnospiraceae bacterium]